MIWDKLKGLFTKSAPVAPARELPEIPVIEAADNPWGVRVLDVRPVTQGMLSTSSDPQCAANAVSYGRDDGTGFIYFSPPSKRETPTNLRFPIDRVLADGVLFVPQAMEHKWALFHHGSRIICVRSWLRQVVVVAEVETHADHLVVTCIRGTFGDDDEPPEFTVRVLDYLLRSHALETVFPAPIPPGLEDVPSAAAMMCMSMFGSYAHYATGEPIVDHPVDKPLRTQSLLHIAVARGDAEEVLRHLQAGLPSDLLAKDGLLPVHWALARPTTQMLALLLDQGADVDARSDEGATALMTVIQSGDLGKVAFLIDRGADVNAKDARGFTSLHRAAEMGHAEIVKVLLDGGADADVEAEGHTPRSLAELREEPAIVRLLE